MYEALEDIKLETIDFNWIKNATKVSHVKRAIKIIEADGDYFKDLKEACFLRLEELDPLQKRIPVQASITPEQRKHIQDEMKDWQQAVQQNKSSAAVPDINLEDYEGYFEKQGVKVSEEKRKGNAERERLKGNEAIKSKDFDEAIGYYTKSIQLDPKMHQSYGNRALAYLKKKQFDKCLADCESALLIDLSYTKAHHRKAKALVGLKRKVEAYKCFKEIMRLEPENTEINKEMKELREEMTEEEIRELESSLLPKCEFKKIVIQEDSDEEDIT